VTYREGCLQIGVLFRVFFFPALGAAFLDLVSTYIIGRGVLFGILFFWEPVAFNIGLEFLAF
jgi:hypothetical protein